jgi:hypothetical protein
MKLADNPPKLIDEVITEVRAIKRSISERYGNDIDRLLDALMIQERCTRIGEAEQVGNGQSATSPESKLEGSDKTQPEAEGRSQ